MFGIGIVLVIVIIACAFKRGPRGISVPLTDLLLAPSSEYACSRVSL